MEREVVKYFKAIDNVFLDAVEIRSCIFFMTLALNFGSWNIRFIGKKYTNNDILNQETAATDESENNDDLEAAIAKAFSDDDAPKKREKILKGIYLDEDVLKVYKKVSKTKGHGWGSQLVSDLLVQKFIRQGIKIDTK
ncbi:hypothetical protein [Peribacillus sp. Bi134]|uniref:hypothetical protein n=1 Tax=Peribacillus sp. Bi134 TaxID=2884272 RepID=UPI001DC615EE|nr:hypothetical protein [Peribacillus sp. Bi134]CAH0142444.1 hypothetical protein SRABI134_00568 [Peribacillus sp. Bi134]